MKKVFYLLSVSLAFTVISCDKADPISIDKVIIENNESILGNRVSHENVGLLNIQNKSSNGAKFKSGSQDETVVLTSADKNFALALVSEVLSPVYEGSTLRSTHVAISGNYAYVSYNTEGNKYLGGIDVIDISEINYPKLISSAKLPNVDVNALAIDGNKLLIAGAADVDFFSDLPTSAWTSYMTLNNGLLGSNYDFTSLYGQAAIDVYPGTSNSNYVVSGSQGVLAKLNKQTGKAELMIDIADLRSVRNVNGKVLALSGTGVLKVYNEALAFEKDINVAQNNTESKRVLDVYQNYVFVPQGKKGFATYNIMSGGLIAEYAIPQYVGNDNNINFEDVVTNSVSVNGDKIFAANGAAGISIYNFDNSVGSANLLGTASFNGLELTSSNFVISRENYVFVASGRGGLKILKMIDLTPKTITCSGNYPVYNKNESWLNINSNDSKNYSGTYNFQGVNVNDELIWCGAIGSIASDLNINSNGKFTVYGTLAASKALNVNSTANIYGAGVVEGNLHLNSNGVLNIIGTVSQGKSGTKTTFHINGKLIIDGEVVVYGDLNLNNSSSVEFKNTSSKLIVYGKITNNNAKIINGNITKVGN
ncbi:LVIVD repeat-containing protein [Sphingobacterium bovistauri]|uniref:LVIVD repeat-containing protein n=1 Tax=Sphingobacterium bovistauri TaxID=2781959 RepID=A0ABS7Z4F8_9SPHI|nr:hypothetical protein [Sphingobacterium bovistauri]MCA5004442.1 hypothetical protein [Sphingobacterium bovistauri]